MDQQLMSAFLKKKYYIVPVCTQCVDSG